MRVKAPQRAGLRAGAWGAAAALACGALGSAQAQSSAAGATLAQTCMACHGPAGNATLANQPSLAGQPRTFLENQLVLIREGVREVPVMQTFVKDLTDEQIVELAKYFAAQRTTARKLAVDTGKRDRGALISKQAQCQTCHLPGYAGQSQVPRLSSQDESYLVTSMRQFRDQPGAGRDSVMSNAVRGMTDAQLADLGHYLASVAPPP
jgi:cytochrome c553